MTANKNQSWSPTPQDGAKFWQMTEAYSRIAALIDPSGEMSPEQVVAEVERIAGTGRQASKEREPVVVHNFFDEAQRGDTSHAGLFEVEDVHEEVKDLLEQGQIDEAAAASERYRRLIADAFDTAMRTGKLPSELASVVAEVERQQPRIAGKITCPECGCLADAGNFSTLSPDPESRHACAACVEVWMRDAEIARLKRRMRNMHIDQCTRENCVLDGGPEHDEAYASDAAARGDKQ